MNTSGLLDSPQWLSWTPEAVYAAYICLGLVAVFSFVIVACVVTQVVLAEFPRKAAPAPLQLTEPVRTSDSSNPALQTAEAG